MENAFYFSNYNNTFSPGFYTKDSCLTEPDQAFAGSPCTPTGSILQTLHIVHKPTGQGLEQAFVFRCAPK